MHGLPQVGDVIDGLYEIRQQIGQGGFGAVFLARHLTMDRDVALKLLVVPPGSNHTEMVERFRREVMAIRNLSHPNTVKIFDYRDSDQGMLYYTMEYLRGLTLKDVAKHEGPQPPRRVKHILRQVLKSLSEAHNYNIVHRDLKPANIMLVEMHGETDFVKVLDFGIAKVLDQNESEDDPLTSAGVLVGTLRYMAPEQITGKPLGAYTDLYSLGLIAVELLTGQSVFAGTGRWDILQKQISDDPVELPAHLRHDALFPILMGALNKEIEGRYQSALEMLKALDSISDSALMDIALTPENISSRQIQTMETQSLPPAARRAAPDPEFEGADRTEMAPSALQPAAPALERPPLITPVPGFQTPPSLDPARRATPAAGDTGERPAAGGGGKKIAMILVPVLLIGLIVGGLFAAGVIGAKPEAAGEVAVAKPDVSPAVEAPKAPDVAPQPEPPEPETPPEVPVEAPTEAPAAQLVELVVPGGPAKVYRDGKLLGVTPYKVEVGEGVALRLEAAGFVATDVKLDAQSPARMEIALAKLPEKTPEKAPEKTPEKTPEKAPEKKPDAWMDVGKKPEKKPEEKKPPSDDWVDVGKKPEKKPVKKPEKKPEVPIF